MKIGIIVAMQSELECVRCLLENPREEQHGSSLFIIGTNGKHELILTQSGIGKVSSAIRTYELIDRYAPDCILNTGVAGGIDRSMHVMDIVVGSEIVYHDVWCGEDCAWGQIDGLPARFHSDPALVEKALKVSTDLSLYKGLVCSGGRFVTDPAELSQRAVPRGHGRRYGIGVYRTSMLLTSRSFPELPYHQRYTGCRRPYRPV